jgi:hypothetical protein
MDTHPSTEHARIAAGLEDARFFLRTQAATLRPDVRGNIEQLIATPPTSAAAFFARLTALHSRHWQTRPRFTPPTNEEVAAEYAHDAIARWTADADGWRAWRNALYYAKQAGAWTTTAAPPETTEDLGARAPAPIIQISTARPLPA